MDYIVTETIQFPKNISKEQIAAFIQPSEAIKFAKMKAKERLKYDSETNFCYFVTDKIGKQIASFFNNKEI